MKPKFNCLMCQHCISTDGLKGKCSLNGYSVNTKWHCEEGEQIWKQQMSESTLEKEKMAHQ